MRTVVPSLLILATLLPAAAKSDEAARTGVDTEHIFGFTEGTDIGDKGEKEIESTFTGRFGKPGSYAAIENETAFRYGVTEGFRASVGLTTSYHAIRGVPDLDDRNAFNVSGVTSEFRWRLLERGPASMGLAVSLAPQARRIEDVSGEPADSFALPITVLIDFALLPEQLFAALNVTYAPTVTRTGGAWTQEHPIELSIAFAQALGPNVFVGAEVRHITRNDDGLFSGHALFAGPSLFVKVSETFSFKAAWSIQIADENSGRLDLVNFERHQVRVLFAKTF